MAFFPDRSSLKTIWILSWPIILSNLSAPMLGAVDTAVIGHLPNPAYLGSVGIGAMIFSFLYWGFGFLRMGTSGYISQAVGAKDATRARTVIAQSFLLGGAIAILILLLHKILLSTALVIIEPSPAVQPGVVAYFDIRIWGAPAALANYTLIGYFVGSGKTKIALILQLILNFINIVLDLVFVVVLEMNIEGVALATVIAEYVAILFGFGFLFSSLKKSGGNWLVQKILSARDLGGLLLTNSDIFIRTVLLIFAFSYFTIAASRLGDIQLAAITVSMNFISFLAFGLDGFAHAAGIQVGKAIGSQNRSLLIQSVRASHMLALLVALGYTLLYALLGSSIIALLTDISEVRLLSESYLPWIVLAPLVAVWSYQFDGIFVGAMKTKEMRNAMILSFLFYFGAIYVLRDPFGAHGLWAAMMIFLAMRGITLWVVYGRVVGAADQN
ncbi:MAG: MATE family efflux transporter [Sneathiellales bacterium]|nr:MATE family efflux transporter [Sneathiellales bacterium]